MRWIIEPADQPKYGDTRIVPSFLLLPKTLKRPDGVLERRWLEEALIKQEYQRSIIISDVGAHDGWADIEWADQ